MRLALLLLTLLSGAATAQTTIQTTAQTTGERLLSGTTLGLPWGIYAGGLTNLQDGEPRLRLSAPLGARVLGTRYTPGTRAALVTYRHDLDARAALAFAVNQLQRQGFELTFRAWPGEGRAQAILRRNETLIEVRITRGAQGVTQALYLFRDGELPERLLTDQLPASLTVYAGPVDLKTVQAEPGRVILTPPVDLETIEAGTLDTEWEPILTAPTDVLLDLTSYRDGVVSLQFYGNFTLDQLKAFYLPFFTQQGFIETADVQEGTTEATFQFARGTERLTVELQASPTTTSRVDLSYQR